MRKLGDISAPNTAGSMDLRPRGPKVARAWDLLFVLLVYVAVGLTGVAVALVHP
jgi:hypothetical protein